MNTDENETLYLGKSFASGPNKSNMVTYTINLDPKCYYNGKRWDATTPGDQHKLFKRVHSKTFYYMYKYLELEDSNMVAFEFCKNGNLHCHGYFMLQKKYGTYEKYIIMINKYMFSCLPHGLVRKYACKVEWAKNEDDWKNYIMKEDKKSGFSYYVTSYCNQERKTIDWYIEKKD